jgi:hypothetical protein
MAIAAVVGTVLTAVNVGGVIWRGDVDLSVLLEIRRHLPGAVHRQQPGRHRDDASFRWRRMTIATMIPFR